LAKADRKAKHLAAARSSRPARASSRALAAHTKPRIGTPDGPRRRRSSVGLARAAGGVRPRAASHCAGVRIASPGDQITTDEAEASQPSASGLGGGGRDSQFEAARDLFEEADRLAPGPRRLPAVARTALSARCSPTACRSRRRRSSGRRARDDRRRPGVRPLTELSRAVPWQGIPAPRHR
jgi:hypothetical protein